VYTILTGAILENRFQITQHVVCGLTCRDCFPKMAPVCIHEVNCLYKVSSY